MNQPWIVISLPKREVLIANRWELLSPEMFLYLCELLQEYSLGRISYRALHIAYVCRYFGLNPAKIKDQAATENLYLLSSQIDFIFKSPGKVNNLFMAQLVPCLSVKGRFFTRKVASYSINTDMNILTCSLTAIQFVEACDLIGCPEEQLPLLAAILYYPGRYSSEKVHVFAESLKKTDVSILRAVSFNFIAFTNYLFTGTDYRILRRETESKSTHEVSIGMAESLYNLSADGLGDVDALDQMPMLKFLSILRKKLIESVRAYHEAEMSLSDISEKTGLSIKTIKMLL